MDYEKDCGDAASVITSNSAVHPFILMGQIDSDTSLTMTSSLQESSASATAPVSSSNVSMDLFPNTLHPSQEMDDILKRDEIVVSFPNDVPISYYIAMPASDSSTNAMASKEHDKNSLKSPPKPLHQSNISASDNSNTEELSDEMIRSFVVGGSSLKSSEQSYSTVHTLHSRIDDNYFHDVVDASYPGDSDDNDMGKNNGGKQVVIVTQDGGEEREMLDSTTCNVEVDMETAGFCNRENEITVALLMEDDCHVTPSQEDATKMFSAEEILRQQPTLNMHFNVEAELRDTDDNLLRREITTQTTPIRRYNRSSPRKRQRLNQLPENLQEVLADEIRKSKKRTRCDLTSKPYKCPLCNIKFADEDVFEAHKKCHVHDEKLFRCYQCTFWHRNWIKMYHHLFTHGVKKPHRCSKCSFSCVSKSDLITHAFVHSKTKDWICDKCHRSFKHRRNLLAHSRTCMGLDSSGQPHKPDESTKHICTVCLKQLANKRNLEKHMEIHTDLKPFVCGLCGHSTRLKESLIMHKRLHTGEKPFKCDKCDYSTPDKSSLRRHKRRHSNDKPYACVYCDYRCIQKHCLDTHVRRKHTGEQFVCGLCHYMTPNRYALNQHFKRCKLEIVSSTSGTGGEVGGVGDAPTAAAIVSLPGNVLSPLPSSDNAAGEEAATTKLEPLELGKEVIIQMQGGAVLGQLAPTTDHHHDEGWREDDVDDTTMFAAGSDGKLVEFRALESTDDMEEAQTIQLSGAECEILQQIQDPDDLVLLKSTGEILVKKTDGRILLIQQQPPHDRDITNADGVTDN